MRILPILLAILIVLAGCNALPNAGNSPSSTATDASGTSGVDTSGGSNNTDIGHENGYSADSTLSINADDGLNKTERKAVVSRAMARVETVRQKEFKHSVPVEIQPRDKYQQNSSNRNITEDFRRFDNAKFEAMFLIGEKSDSLSVQNESRGQNILGYYSPEKDSIVIVSNSETPTLNGESTLAHELTHALQDQHFNLSSYNRSTRDEHNAVNGLIEGDASLVQEQYMSHCGNEWECLPSSGSESGSQPPSNWGVYFLNYFPYADGPGFVEYNKQRGGWERVNGLFSKPPASAEQVMQPEKYDADEPTNVSLNDRTRNGWERVRLGSSGPGSSRPDYATLGQSALTSMFAQTAFDQYNRSAVVPRRAIVNTENGETNQSDPLNYDLPVTNGWDGDRMHVYQKNGETAYVWKLKWDSSKNASQFADAYRQLLSHWGATKAGPNTWVIKNSPYADAFSVRVSGDTVTIVNAPTAEALDDVHQT